MKGFTLIETLIVMVILIFFMGMVSINILNIEPSSSIRLNTSTIISDIKKQQLKAMTGATYNNLTSNFGIYFETNKYTLFAGDSFQAGNAANVAITLPQRTTISATSFPSSTIVFVKLTGEISNFVNGSNTVTLKNLNSNETKTITLNKLGVVTAVN